MIVNPKTQLYLMGAGVVAAVVVAWYAKNKAIETAGKVAEAVNPLNNENVIYGTVNETLFKDGGSLGTKIYDWLHPDNGI